MERVEDERAARGDGPRAAPPRWAAGATLAIAIAHKIPRVCLKCAATRGIVRRRETFTVGTSGAAYGAAGGLAGAVVVSTVRHDPESFLPVAALLVAGVGVIAWSIQKRATKVTIAVPLCEDCDRRWSRGLSLRRLLVVVLAASGLAALTGLVAWPPLVALGAAGFAGAIAVALVARLPNRFLGASRMTSTILHITGVAPEAMNRVSERLRQPQPPPSERPVPRPSE